MEYLSLILIALGLSADALAVTISDTLTYPDLGRRKWLLPTFFGVFQGVMPLIGFALGALLGQYIEAIDHWVALVLLCALGIKTIVETYKENREDNEKDDQQEVNAPKQMKLSLVATQAVATSIDAMAVGITLAVAVDINVFVSAAVICAVTFAMCTVGLLVGKIGKYLKGYAGYIGGVILIAIGVKIFLEHIIG